MKKINKRGVNGISFIIDKKGELTSKQLITIIILIVSFAIILIFFASLGLRKTIDSESCRNSVILRGSLPFGADVVKLKCKTKNVCLSMGGKCDITREELTTIKVEDEGELIKEMVNLLWDCWWMMGEGKVDYMSSALGKNEAYCSICSKVYFDNKIQEKYKEQGGIPYSLIYNYMKSVKVPERDESFLFSIYGVNSMDSIRQDLLVNQRYDIYQYKLNPEEEQVVVTAINRGGWSKGWFGLGGAIGGAITGAKIGSVVGTAGSPVGTILGGVGGVIVGAIGGIVVTSVNGDDIYYLAPRYVEFKGKELKVLDCKEYVSEG